MKRLSESYERFRPVTNREFFDVVADSGHPEAFTVWFPGQEFLDMIFETIEKRRGLEIGRLAEYQRTVIRDIAYSD